MRNKRVNGWMLILVVFILVLAGIYDYVGAGVDTEAPTCPSNLQLMLDTEQIDLGQNNDENKNEKYGKYNEWVDSLKDKLKNYNSKPKLKLSWDPSSDNAKVLGYKIFRNGIEIGTTEATTFIDENFMESISYKYYVAAFDAAMNLSMPSNVVGYGIDTTPPSAPKLSANALGDRSIRLSWNEATDDNGVQEYIIFRNGLELKRVNSLNYEDTMLSPLTAYEYIVKAVDISGNVSEGSNIVKVEISITSVNDGLTFVKQNSSIVLNWNKVDGYVSYNIYRKTGSSGTFAKIAGATSNSYIDNSLILGNTYYYEIGYVNENGFEMISSPVEVCYSNGTSVSGVLSGSRVWTSTASPYTISSSVTLASGATLKIMPGTVIKFARGACFMVDGNLEALGTAQYPIVFTSSGDPTYGGTGVDIYNFWGSIVVGGSGSFMGDYTKIIYAGNTICNYPGILYVKGKLNLTNSKLSDYTKTGIYLENSGLAIIRNNTLSTTASCDSISIVDGGGKYYIENNTITCEAKNYGIYIRSYSTNSPNRLSIKKNTINTGRSPIVVLLDGVSGDLSTITSGILENTFYPSGNTIGLRGCLRSKLTIPKGIFGVEVGTMIAGGAELTLSPGAVIRLPGHTDISILGKLTALGTVQEPIVITAENDRAYGGQGISSNWDYFCIRVENGGEFTADHTKITYGGNSQSGLNLGVGIYAKGNLNITNSEISNSYGSGIYYSGGVTKLLFNTFKNNNKYAIYSGSGMLNASYNYWDSPSGPGLNQNAVYNVIYTPLLGGGYDEQLHFGDDSNFSGGNFSRSYSDMTVDVSGFELNIGRTYNSRDGRTSSALGRGWSFSLEGNMKDYGSAGAKIVRLPDGSVQSFYYDGSSYIACDSRNKLTKQTDGTFVMTTKDQYKYGFNQGGCLVWMKDRNDNTLTITFNSEGKVIWATDAAGRKINVSYNVQGMISAVTDFMGRTTRYDYTNGRLTKVTDPSGKVANYSYDANGYLNQIRDGALNPIESVTYNHLSGQDQDKVTCTTDSFGNVTSYKYDNQNRTTTLIDSNGKQKTTWYDALGYPIKIQDYEGKFTLTQYNVESTGMNKYGEEKSITDRNGNTTQYLRDCCGNITKITNTDGSFKENIYDQNNNLISQKDENGKYTFYIYDEKGINLRKKVQPLNGVDQYSSLADQSKFAITQYEYYSDLECQSLGYIEKGLLKNEIDPMGGITLYTYDNLGNVKTIKDAEEKITNYSYNQIGWKTGVVSPKGYVTAYVYENDGRIEKTVLNNGETTRIVYDGEGRKTKEISANLYNAALDDISSHTYSGDCGYRYEYYPSGKVKSVKDPENNVTSYIYNLYGDIITETKPNGAVYQYEYDVMNRLSKVWFKENELSGAVLQEEYAYNILNDGKTQKIVTKYLNSVQKAVTTYTYDYAERLVEQINPDGSTEKVSYNENGTIASSTDANGNTSYYAYDGLNRQTEKWTPFEMVNGAVKYAYTGVIYDFAGRKKAEISCKDTVNLNGVPTSDIATINYDYYKNGKVKSVYDSSGRRKNFAYDDDGNLAKEDAYIDSDNVNIVEYINNHFGKAIEKRVHVRKGDIFENNFENNDDLVLSTVYSYDKSGNLKTEMQPNGFITTYEYDNLNRQTKVSQNGQDEFESLTEISKLTSYNYDGKPLLVTDENGNTTKYIYNQKGLLEKVIDANGGVTSYYYDTAGRKTAEVSPKDYSSSKSLEEMNRTQYSYDLADRLISKSSIYYDTQSSQWITINKSYNYDQNGNMLSETDALGNKTSYLYNLNNKQVSLIDPVSRERGLAFTTKYEYDALGRKVSETNAAGVITSYYYNDEDNLIKTSVKKTLNDSEIAIQSNTYDLLGNVLTKTDAEGNVITFEYNALGKLKSVVYPGDLSIPEETIIYQYDEVGNLKLKKDSSGKIDLFTYDNQGRELSHIEQNEDGSGSIKTSIRYDKCGNKRFITDGNGGIKENTFDKLNRIKSTIINVSGQKQTTSFVYDANGNLLATTDWRGNIYTNVYDGVNRLIEKKNPDNKSIQKLEYNLNNVQIKSYDALGNVTEYTYDKNNRLLSTIHPESHTVSQTYDNAGNVKTKTDGNGNITTFNYDQFNRLVSVINANNETTSYAYDKNGNMTSQSDAKQNKTIFEYNVRNKLMAMNDGASSEKYTYFADGSLKCKIDRNGNNINYDYDCHGRMISEKVGEISISYIYDDNGNRLSMTDNCGVTTQTFDQLNRIKTKEVSNVGKISYVYDITSDIQDGNIKQQSTDSKGNVVEKVFDKEGRLKEATAHGQTTVYEYNEDGSKKSVIYPNGSKEEYNYYKDGLLKTLINKKADGSIIDTYSYTYDASHNQISKNESKGITNYTYDCLNRLQSVTEPGGKVTTYKFDGAGNRISETVVENGSTSVAIYTYNEQNRLLSTQTKVDGTVAEEKHYTYDNNGNVLTESDGSKNVVNTYDEFNQLIKVVSNDMTVVNTYNGDGIRTAKSINGKLTKYLYEGDKIVLELDQAGNQKAQNIQGTNLISRQIDGQTLYYLYNGHGDVTGLIDSNGQIAASYYYDAFGNIVESNGTIDNPFRFSGYQYDTETGDYYLMSRMYDPQTARFLQEDSYRGDVRDPLSLNLYTYCHNEPIMYIDPTGHWAEDGSDKKYKRYTSVYNKISDLSWQYDHAKTNEERRQIAQNTATLRGIADVQIKLRQLNYAGADGKQISVDGVMGKNTAGAMNYFTKVNNISEYSSDRRDIDGATYNAIMAVKVPKGVAVDDDYSDKWNKSNLSLTYYNQGDSRWGSIKYSAFNDDRWKTANGGKPQNIAGTGCGPTSMAIVLSSFTGQDITPDMTAEDAINVGCRTQYNGTTAKFFTDEANKYNLQVRSTRNVEEVKTALSDGKHLVIVSMGPGHFTGGGHYIVLGGIENEDGLEKFTVLDPNMNNGRYKKYNDGNIELTNTKGIVKANVKTVSKEVNSVGYFIYSR